MGLGQTASVTAVVLACALALAVTGALLGAQVLRILATLPQYENTIQQKLQSLDEMSLGRLDTLTREADRLLDESSVPSTASTAATPSSAKASLAMEAPPQRAASLQTRAALLASAWALLESTGIVLLVLVFVLLDQEALRDRFIRMAGGANIRLTTLALNDVGERLSRYFVSQFAVNLGVGAAIGLGLALLGVPQAALWGAIAALLRFVPYIGVWLAAIPATALAIAVAPGWSLAASTLALFTAVELIAAQAIEPYLYGHRTGLSPLSVIVAAIFWSALWGPIGLVLSTPLTLCVLVIGRHIRALRFLELLLGVTQTLSQPQKFYQRALSGDADEILLTARGFLKRNSFASYCDLVLLPAIHLAALDFEAGAISEDQRIKLRNVLITVVSTLSGEPRRFRRHRSSVLDNQNPGRILRQHREQLTGQWQGPLAVESGSILLCLGLAASGDTIAAELLVRALREEHLDARHISMEDLDEGSRPPGANPAAVAIAFLISAFPGVERERYEQTIERLRQHFPAARIVTVSPPGISIESNVSTRIGAADYAVSSFVEAVEICIKPKPAEV
jgi:predicted PurR-regulated permease PerM